MKIGFFSDVHGVADSLKKYFAKADALGVKMHILLGDVLYHGPRNGLPVKYDPVEVARLLNERAGSILAVRGNCDAEVDQMMLDFPMMSDYSLFADGEKRFFLTHGHLYSPSSPPPLEEGMVFASGHTHIPLLEKNRGNATFFNPGSISLPKGGHAPSFGFFDGRELSIQPL